MLKREKKTSLKSITVAALVAGTAGAVAGLLLAPKSGKVLRQEIQAKTGDFVGQVEDTTIKHAEALRQQSTELVEKGKKLASDLQTLIQDLRAKKQGYIDIAQTSTSEPAVEAEMEPAPPVFGPENPFKDE